MKYIITDIEFDFSNDDNAEMPDNEYQEKLIEQVKSRIWEVENPDEELADLVSDETGWCVQSLDYDKLSIAIAKMRMNKP